MSTSISFDEKYDNILVATNDKETIFFTLYDICRVVVEKHKETELLQILAYYMRKADKIMVEE